MTEARDKGMIRFISLSNHRLDLALEAARSGLYDTIQFPLSSLSSDKDLELIDVCREKNIGLIAMKALSGGLITNAASTFAFLRQYKNVVPIWGIQHMFELEEFITLDKNPPALDEAMWQVIRKDREELAGNFCRACGYCMPCPNGIQISTAARMKMLLRRAVYQRFLTDEWKREMEKIDGCDECGQCKEQCPYDLDTPALLKFMKEDYMAFYREHVGA
jgi:predicted aldo/keto reductase-like oxidoreductase